MHPGLCSPPNVHPACFGRPVLGYESLLSNCPQRKSNTCKWFWYPARNATPCGGPQSTCKQYNEKTLTPHLIECGRKKRIDGREKTAGRQAFRSSGNRAGKAWGCRGLRGAVQ